MPSTRSTNGEKNSVFNFRFFPLTLLDRSTGALGERVCRTAGREKAEEERLPYGNECLRRVAIEALSNTCTWWMLNNSTANFHSKSARICTYPRTCRRFCFLHTLGPKHGHWLMQLLHCHLLSFRKTVKFRKSLSIFRLQPASLALVPLLSAPNSRTYRCVDIFQRCRCKQNRKYESHLHCWSLARSATENNWNTKPNTGIRCARDWSENDCGEREARAEGTQGRRSRWTMHVISELQSIGHVSPSFI